LPVLEIVLMLLVLAACVGVPLGLYLRLRRRNREDIERLMERVDRSLDAAVKLLEVRNYYQETAESLNALLQEAYREGNRFRQDQIRKLIERLEALKSRTLDRSVAALQGEPGATTRRKRRRSRRSRRRRRPRPPQPDKPAAQ